MTGRVGLRRFGHAQMLADAISNRLGNVLILGVQVHRVGFLLGGQRLKPALLGIQQLFRCLRGIAFAFAHPLPAQGFRRLAMQQRALFVLALFVAPAAASSANVSGLLRGYADDSLVQ